MLDLGVELFTEQLRLNVVAEGCGVNLAERPIGVGDPILVGSAAQQDDTSADGGRTER